MNLAVHSGSPSSDLTAYRRCLGQFATGVTVVATKTEHGLAAMTSNSFASVSLEPSLILWSIKRSSSNFDNFASGRYFSVNVLAHDQIEMSRQFAKSGQDKFRGVEFSEGLGGVPLIAGAVATFECELEEVLDGGDHAILLGRVETYSSYDRLPLVFAQGRYAGLSVQPEIYLDGVAPRGNDVPAEYDSEALMTSLFLRAYKAMGDVFAKAREMEDLTLLESMLLRTMKSHPGRTMDALLPEILLGSNVGRSVFQQVCDRRLATVDAQGRATLTALGAACIERLMQRSLALERERFRDLPAADIAATRRVLQSLASG